MEMLREIPYEECRQLLSEGSVGRVALCTPDGPHIVPVSYVVDGDAVVFRTTAYSVLGSYADGARLAFEVDTLNYDERAGWSVVAVGRGSFVKDAVDVAKYRVHDGPRPWAGGIRSMHLRLHWNTLTGRRIGARSATAMPIEPADAT